MEYKDLKCDDDVEPGMREIIQNNFLKLLRLNLKGYLNPFKLGYLYNPGKQPHCDEEIGGFRIEQVKAKYNWFKKNVFEINDFCVDETYKSVFVIIVKYTMNGNNFEVMFQLRHFSCNCIIDLIPDNIYIDNEDGTQVKFGLNSDLFQNEMKLALEQYVKENFHFIQRIMEKESGVKVTKIAWE